MIEVREGSILLKLGNGEFSYFEQDEKLLAITSNDDITACWIIDWGKQEISYSCFSLGDGDPSFNVTGCDMKHSEGWDGKPIITGWKSCNLLFFLREKNGKLTILMANNPEK